MRPAAWTGLAAAGAVALLSAALALEAAGYVPCELCLLDRVPLALAVGVGVGSVVASRGGAPRLASTLRAACAACLAAAAALGAYHLGVERGLWAGPSGCTGLVASPASVDDLLAAMARTRVVRCDVPALEVAGLSLAGWDALACLALAALASRGLGRDAVD